MNVSKLHHQKEELERQLAGRGETLEELEQTCSSQLRELEHVNRAISADVQDWIEENND